MKVKIVLAKDAQVPARATKDSAGYDLVATERVELDPGARAMCGTGIKLEIEPGHAALVCPRSGMAIKKGVSVINAPGIIDADFRAEVKVLLINHGDETHIVWPGDRIAQLVFVQLPEVTWCAEAALSDTDRGEGGFGSTGG